MTSIITTSPEHEAEHSCFYWQCFSSDLHRSLTNVGNEGDFPGTRLRGISRKFILTWRYVPRL